MLLPYEGKCQSECALRTTFGSVGRKYVEFPAGANVREMVSHKV